MTISNSTPEERLLWIHVYAAVTSRDSRSCGALEAALTSFEAVRQFRQAFKEEDTCQS